MKNIKTILLLMIVAISAVACDPTSREQQIIINQYHNQTEFYKFVTVYRSNYRTDSVTYYIAAKDKYEAERLSDAYLKNNSDLKIVSIKSQEIIFTNYQQYPYQR